jgi:hypothetical protein
MILGQLYLKCFACGEKTRMGSNGRLYAHKNPKHEDPNLFCGASDEPAGPNLQLGEWAQAHVGIR